MIANEAIDIGSFIKILLWQRARFKKGKEIDTLNYEGQNVAMEVLYTGGIMISRWFWVRFLRCMAYFVKNI